jgi:hypothetical protein
MPWVLHQTDGDKLYYGGPDKGWLPNPPGPPPDPKTIAMQFPDQSTADAYAKQYGMKATSEQV